jgi:TonB-dependent starch-binding outer membrane protein SusC
MSKFRFLYNSKMVDVNRKVSVQFEDFTINQAMDVLFEDVNVDYTIIDRQIVLSAKGSPVYKSGFVQQQAPISGKVTDASGQPLPGVSIIVKGTTTGTVTDVDGNFSLTLPENAEVLAFSFVGMKTQEIPIRGRTTFNIVMEEEAIGIEEVVAIGYGTQRRENVTGR